MAAECGKSIDQDVVEQILLLLPPKTLMRFKCVSKRWYALITNPRFVAKHLSCSKHNNLSTASVLLKRLVSKEAEDDDKPEMVFSFLKFRNNIDNDGEHAHDQHNSYFLGVEDVENPPKTSSELLHVVGHCDGIICLHVFYTCEVILWNPAIHESKLLPPEPCLQGYGFYYYAVAFGYDPNSKGYIVVKIASAYPIDKERDDDGYCIYYPPKAIIYTHLGTGSDSWREIKTCSLETETTLLWPETFQMYFKNVCYWTGQEQHKELHVFEEQEEQFIGNVIIFFDPVDEVFHDMLFPDCFYDKNEFFFGMRLLVWNESISLSGLQNTHEKLGVSFGIWVMDELGGPKGAWTKHIAFELTEKPLAFLNNDEILLADTEDTNGHIISYNLSTKKLKHLPVQCVLDDDYTAVAYVNSIVSVLGGNRLGSRADSSNAEISLSNYTSSPLSHSIIERTHSYSVWAIPHDEVSIRVKKVMEGLRAEFGGPDIEPHIPIVGSIRMTHEDMLNRFTDVQSRFISVFKAKVARVVFRSSYYQCVSLLMESSFTTQNESFEIMELALSCNQSFCFHNRVRPLLSLHYGYLTEEEQKTAEEKIKILDESITSMSVPITRLALYKIDYKDTTLKSWEKIAEYPLLLKCYKCLETNKASGCEIAFLHGELKGGLHKGFVDVIDPEYCETAGLAAFLKFEISLV